MDHYGLLRLTRQVERVLLSTKEARITGTPEWKWNGTSLIYPESKCPFCLTAIRSPGIWILNGAIQNKLMGAFFPEQGKKVSLIQPSHPHDTGGGSLCLGGHTSGVALFAHPINLRDCPMGSGYVPRWLKLYWNRHECEESRRYIQGWTYDHARVLRELDEL